MRSRRLLGALAFTSTVVGSVACLQATQIEVTLRTDVPYQPGRTVAISVSKEAITDATAPSTTAEDAWQADGKIGTLVLLPSDQRDEPVSVRAVLGLGRDPSTCTLADAKGCIFARRKLAFVPHEPLALPITLYAACEGVPCDESSTCTALGTCVPADVDPAACADGNTCDVPAGAAVSPRDDGGSRSSSSGGSFEDGGGSTEDDASISSSSSSGGSSGTPDAGLDAGADAGSDCDPTDVTVPTSGFFSFGTVTNTASVTNGDPFVIGIDTAGKSATFERKLPITKTACPLHFVMDVASLDVSDVGTKVVIMTVKRGVDGDLVLQAARPAAADTLELSVVGFGTTYAWKVPRAGKVELVVPLVKGAIGTAAQAYLVVRTNSGSNSVLGLGSAAPTETPSSISIQFGLTGAPSKVGYHSARYFFGPLSP